MRFVITGEWKTNSLLRLVIVLFLGFAAFLWLTNALLYFAKMGLTPESVAQYYRGNEERYLSPRSYIVLLEISHFHLFAMSILLLTLGHLVLFAPIRPQWKACLIVVSFCSAFSDEAMGWLTRYVHAGFAFGKIMSLLLLQISLAAMIGIIFYGTIKPRRNAYSDPWKGEKP